MKLKTAAPYVIRDITPAQLLHAVTYGLSTEEVLAQARREREIAEGNDRIRNLMRTGKP